MGVSGGAIAFVRKCIAHIKGEDTKRDGPEQPHAAGYDGPADLQAGDGIGGQQVTWIPSTATPDYYENESGWIVCRNPQGQREWWIHPPDAPCWLNGPIAFAETQEEAVVLVEMMVAAPETRFICWAGLCVHEKRPIVMWSVYDALDLDTRSYCLRELEKMHPPTFPRMSIRTFYDQEGEIAVGYKTHCVTVLALPDVSRSAINPLFWIAAMFCPGFCGPRHDYLQATTFTKP